MFSLRLLSWIYFCITYGRGISFFSNVSSSRRSRKLMYRWISVTDESAVTNVGTGARHRQEWGGMGMCCLRFCVYQVPNTFWLFWELKLSARINRLGVRFGEDPVELQTRSSGRKAEVMKCLNCRIPPWDLLCGKWDWGKRESKRTLGLWIVWMHCSLAID